MRDTHRHLVYRAEDQVARVWARDAQGPVSVDFHGSLLLLPVQRRFGNLAAVQRYCDGALAGRPTIPAVSVRRRRGRTRAHWSWPGEIAVPDSPWAMRELVVVHELAHHVAAHTDRADPVHGPGFVTVYRDLLADLAGPEVALLLTAGLHEAGFPLADRRTP